MAALGAYARRLEVRSDFLELLPRDSPRFRAFEHQLGRVGGGSTLIVIVSSPDRASNERFVDDLSAKLAGLAASEATRRALLNPELQKAWGEQGYVVWSGSPEQLAQRAAAERAMWGPVTKGISVD